MQAAALAHGVSFCLLLGFFALLAAASLSSQLKTVILLGLTQWNPASTERINNLITQTAIAWQPLHYWLLLAFSGVLALGLWLKVVGVAQRIIQTAGQSASYSPISIQQRLGTLLLALTSGLLLILAYGLVFAALPDRTDTAIAPATIWIVGQRFFIQGLRWSLALSTVSLMVGLFYRFSFKATAHPQPILPGTVLTTLFWSLPSVLLKVQVSAWQNHHWLYSLFSTITIILIALYLNTIGLLLGGQFNVLVGHHFSGVRSRSQHRVSPPPPPSFDSFTIQRRSDKTL